MTYPHNKIIDHPMRIHPVSLPLIFTGVLLACTESGREYTSFDEYPTPVEAELWLNYEPDATSFKLWSPTADAVYLNLYEKGDGGEPMEIHPLSSDADGLWSITLEGDLQGTYYTYQVKSNGQWMDETPGIYAQAVGVNGQRAMVLDFDITDPEGWEEDHGPQLNSPNDAIIYEMHVRDMTIHPESGSSLPGKFTGFVEEGTKGPGGVSTGIDHLVELGITHVHLLPSFDHYSIKENQLDSPQFNWGYDPQNYNVPEGSFSTNPHEAEVRIREFKEMVMKLHEKGIGVILDVVYNHTGRTDNSNFNLEAPGYYYRFREDGSYSDAAACGNETASERAMVRKFILESVSYWAEEYHIDGFRFDLMGIHDITTMNEVAETLEAINPHIFVYGEGWTAGDSPLPIEDRALKANILKMPNIIAFSDDIRDGLKGSVFEDESTGFVSGMEDMEESVKFGVVGAIDHPQIDYNAVNYSNAPWANEPWQSISYVSCHDNHTLYDKLKVSRRDATEWEIIAMHKLANGVVLTSQGIAFLHAGVELLRTKDEEHNSYNLPDEINQINWRAKTENPEVVEYYRNLITLRKTHPAFRMTTAEDVRKNLEFDQVEDGLISYTIRNNANGDDWNEIHVVYNGRPEEIYYELDGSWNIAVLGDAFDLDGIIKVTGVSLPEISMAVFFRN